MRMLTKCRTKKLVIMLILNVISTRLYTSHRYSTSSLASALLGQMFVSFINIRFYTAAVGVFKYVFASDTPVYMGENSYLKCLYIWYGCVLLYSSITHWLVSVLPLPFVVHFPSICTISI